MKYILVLSMLAMTACASSPYSDDENDHGLLKVKACVFDTMVFIMSVGDPRTTEDFCHVTKAKEALWELK